MVVAGYVLASLFGMALLEYAVHRWPMHTRLPAWVYRRAPALRQTRAFHAGLHHGRYYRQFDSEPDPAGRWFGLTIDGVATVLALTPAWVPLLWLDGRAALIIVLVAAGHAAVWNVCHPRMHMPRGGWLERTWFFRTMREHHRLHHECPHANFGAVFWGTDYLFGTKWRAARPDANGGPP